MSPTTHSWRALGDLDLLLRPGGLLELLRASGVGATAAHADYLRLKPGTGALVGVTVAFSTGEGERACAGYVRTQPEGRTAELVAKFAPHAWPAPDGGAGVRGLRGGRSVLFVFPNDARVRGLRFVAEPDKLKRTLAELPLLPGGPWRVRARRSVLAPVRYKPERRFILRGDLGLRDDATGEKARRSVFVRFFTDDRGRRIEPLLRALHARHPALVPDPIGCAAGGRLWVEGEVTGSDLAECTRDADPAVVARALHALHATEPGVPLPELPPAAAAANAIAAADNLAAVAPGLAPLAAEVAGRLRAAIPAATRPALIHGDCHLHQFLARGDRVALVDFERAALGDPRLDLGHLVAHAESLALREPARAGELRAFAAAVRERYLAAAPAGDERELGFFVACGLLERALLPFRRLEIDWPDRCAAVLERTRAALDGVQRRPRLLDWHGTAGAFHPNRRRRWPGHLRAADGERTFGWYDTAAGTFTACELAADDALPARHLAHDAKLLAYRPGRRATLRTKDGDYLKLLRADAAERAARRLAILRDAVADRAPLPRIPALLLHRPGAVVLAPLPGRTLEHAIHGGGGPAALEATARALAALHALPAPAALPALEPPRPLAAWLAFVRDHDPAIARRAAELADRFAALPAGPFGPADRIAHGDLHERNIVIDGDRAGLLDLDSAGRGDAQPDVANLLAHVLLRALQNGGTAADAAGSIAAFLRAYRAAGAALDAGGLRAEGARTLLRLVCVHRFRSPGHELAPALIDAAARWADGTFTAEAER